MTPSRRLLSPSVVAFFLTLTVLLLLFLSLLYNYTTTKNNLTSLTYSRRQSLTNLSATIVKNRLDNLTELGVSLATRVQFRRLIAAGEWQEAVDILASIPTDFPYIDRVFLADPEGILKADTPPLPNVRGTDFSFRDWYQGVTQSWQPYVSSAYVRQAEPQYQVVAVAIPITSENGERLGILVLQVKLETFLEWANNIGIKNATVSLSDHSGQLIGKTDGQIMYENLRGNPLVDELLTGQSGLKLTTDPASKKPSLIATEIIPDYGWGVIISEPSSSAFADRTQALNNLLIFSLVIFLIAFFFAAILYQTFLRIDREQQRVNLLLNNIGDGVIAIDSNWTITLFNPAAVNITGLSQSAALGKPLKSVLKFLRETDHQEDYSFIEDAILTKTTKHIETPTILVHQNGQDIPVGDSASPLINGLNNVVGAIIVIRNLTHEPALHRLHPKKNNHKKTAKS